MMTWITVLEIHCAKGTIGKYGYYAPKNRGEVVFYTRNHGRLGVCGFVAVIGDAWLCGGYPGRCKESG